MSLVGGHGTAIAWGPTIAAEHGFPAALESGIAVATIGLIIASLLGGPLAKLLIERNRLEVPGTAPEDGELPPEADAAPIDKMGVMRAMLAVNVAVILGYLVHAWLTEATGINLPLFVPCLIMGILLSNTVPLVFPRLQWPAHTAALELVSSYALSIFLAMSLMSMQLWTLAGSAAALFVIVAVQTVVAAAYILLRGLSGARPRLSGGRAVGRLHRAVARLDADGDRQHVGDHPALRAGAERLRDPAAGLGLLRRHRQRRGDLALPPALTRRSPLLTVTYFAGP